MLDQDSKGRLERLKEEADLEAKLAEQYGGSGNREFERSEARAEQLQDIIRTLDRDSDPTLRKTTGYIYKRVEEVFGFPVFSSPEFLSIGLEPDRDIKIYFHAIRNIILGTLHGTRREILEAFLRRQVAKAQGRLF